MMMMMMMMMPSLIYTKFLPILMHFQSDGPITALTSNDAVDRLRLPSAAARGTLLKTSVT